MPAKRFLLNPSRTAKQGVGINVGKFTEEYERAVSVMTMHPDDMAAIPTGWTNPDTHLNIQILESSWNRLPNSGPQATTGKKK